MNFKKVFLLIGVVLLILSGILILNTFRFTSRQTFVAESPGLAIGDTSILHFQQSIRFQTISYGDSAAMDSSQFLNFHRFLEKAYPNVHTHLRKEVVNKYSLLYEWKGRNPALKPIILMAHQDVVPVEEASRNKWTVDPFAGVLKDNRIWGRGAIDDKVNLISIMESAEQLLAASFVPERGIYFVFGHDEEASGSQGAAKIAELLRSRRVKAEFVLDEGGIVTRQKVPGMENKPVALIGTSEKGYMSLTLSVEIPGGHSSMPEKEVAIDVLNKALVRLRDNPFPALFTPTVEEFLDHVGPEMPFAQKLVIANRWLFRPLLVRIYEKSAAGNATVRTTLVPTILASGMKDNVVPTVARAVVNCRMLPGNSAAQVLEHVRMSIDDKRVVITTLGPVFEASGFTSTRSKGYQHVERQVRQSMKGVYTTPFMMIGATDSRYFVGISETILKFSPMEDPAGFHGLDEHIEVESYKRCISFYYHLMRNLD